jgi:hypothetical protein
MFKPIRVLVGFLFVVGMLGYLSNKDTDKTAAATARNEVKNVD